MGAAAFAEKGMTMGMAAALPTLSRDDTPALGGLRRNMPGWGLLGSVLLHGIALACVVEWQYGALPEEPSATEVSLVQELPLPAVEATPPSLMQSQSKALPVQPHQTPAPGHAHKSLPAAPASPQIAFLPVADTSPISPQLSGTAGGDEHGDDGGNDGKPGNAGQDPAADGPAVPAAGNAPPTYPMSARRAGREGRAVLSVLVSNTGDSKDVMVEETSGTPPLDEAALAAVRHWHFHPAIRNGQRVEARIRIPVTFSLIDQDG